MVQKVIQTTQPQIGVSSTHASSRTRTQSHRLGRNERMRNIRIQANSRRATTEKFESESVIQSYEW